MIEIIREENWDEYVLVIPKEEATMVKKKQKYTWRV